MVLHQLGQLCQGVLLGRNRQIQFAIRTQPGAEADNLAARRVIVATDQALIDIGVNAGHPLGLLMQRLRHRLPRLVIGMAEDQIIAAGRLRMAQTR